MGDATLWIYANGWCRSPILVKCHVSCLWSVKKSTGRLQIVNILKSKGIFFKGFVIILVPLLVLMLNVLYIRFVYNFLYILLLS